MSFENIVVTGLSYCEFENFNSIESWERERMRKRAMKRKLLWE